MFVSFLCSLCFSFRFLCRVRVVLVLVCRFVIVCRVVFVRASFFKNENGIKNKRDETNTTTIVEFIETFCKLAMAETNTLINNAASMFRFRCMFRLDFVSLSFRCVLFV